MITARAQRNGQSEGNKARRPGSDRRLKHVGQRWTPRIPNPEDACGFAFLRFPLGPAKGGLLCLSHTASTGSNSSCIFRDQVGHSNSLSSSCSPSHQAGPAPTTTVHAAKPQAQTTNHRPLENNLALLRRRPEDETTAPGAPLAQSPVQEGQMPMVW